jgi:hypothetical protein
MERDIKVMAASAKMVQNAYAENCLLKRRLREMQQWAENAERQSHFLTQSLVDVHISIGNILNSVDVGHFRWIPSVKPTHFPLPSQVAFSALYTPPGQPTQNLIGVRVVPSSNEQNYETCVHCGVFVGGHEPEGPSPVCDR